MSRRSIRQSSLDPAPDYETEFLHRVGAARKSYDGKSLDLDGFKLYDCILDYLAALWVENDSKTRDIKAEQEISLKEMMDKWSRREGRPLSAQEESIFKFAAAKIDERMASRYRLNEAVSRIEIRGLNPKVVRTEPFITDSEPVCYSSLFKPICFRNRKYYQIATSRYRMLVPNRYSSNVMPLIRDANNAPFTLPEELGVGSIVQIRIDADGLMAAVRVLEAKWADPFNLNVIV